jgi:peptide/nickel transport system substrate-binding protein
MYSLAWVGVKNPDIFHYVFHSDSVPPNGANRGRYHSKQANTFIETATLATGIEQQSQQYRALQAHLLNDLPYVPLWYKDQVLLRHARVKNYQIYGDGRYDGLLKVTQSSP